jgi:hypothetical protein
MTCPANKAVNSDPFGSQQADPVSYDPFSSHPAAASSTNGTSFDPFETHSSNTTASNHNPNNFVH